MWTNIFQRFIDRILTIGKPGQIYIIPTFDGIKLLALNGTLLVIGLVYANNFVLLFNFILFCLFLGSMYYTHFNLRGIEVISVRQSQLHVNETGSIKLALKSSSELGHFFVSCRPQKSLYAQLDHNFKFSIDKSTDAIEVDIPLLGIKRGIEKVETIVLETLFPFHLFRCFTLFKTPLQIVVYPERKNLNMHSFFPVPETSANQGDDFVLKNYQTGDSLKRVHWKKLAQSNRWYSKSIIAPTHTPVILSLDETKIELKDKGRQIEDQLSSICHDLYRLQSQQIDFGLMINGELITPAKTTNHLRFCLRVLASYEN